MTPEPRLMVRRSRGGTIQRNSSPKNRLKKGSSKKGLGTPLSLTLLVVEMLTTEAFTASTTWAMAWP